MYSDMCQALIACPFSFIIIDIDLGNDKCYVLYLKSGAVIRLPKFEVELPPHIPYKPKQFMLLERDVTISVL